jgi:hypothetical protein
MLYVVAALVGVGAIVAVTSLIGQDVRSARRIFAGLVAGDQRVCRQIAWDRFTVLDADLGQVYRELADDQERTQYTQAFVSNFAAAFQREGGKVTDFVNWRKDVDAKGGAVVAADFPAWKKTLHLRVGGSGFGQRSRLEAMQWKEAGTSGT